MKPSFALRRLRLTFFVSLLSCLVAAPLALAQGAGTVTGRVFNPATGEYVRNAEVSVQGGSATAITEVGGYYTLTNVPAGDAILSVRYTGYDLATAKVNVTPGGTATADVNLTSSLY